MSVEVRAVPVSQRLVIFVTVPLKKVNRNFMDTRCVQSVYCSYVMCRKFFYIFKDDYVIAVLNVKAVCISETLVRTCYIRWSG